MSFDVPPRKPIEEVSKVFQLIESALKLMDESSDAKQCYQNLKSLADAKLLPQFSSKLSLLFPSFIPKKIRSCARINFLHSESLKKIMDGL